MNSNSYNLKTNSAKPACNSSTRSRTSLHRSFDVLLCLPEMSLGKKIFLKRIRTYSFVNYTFRKLFCMYAVNNYIS